MIDFSTRSPVFILLIVLAPFLLRYRSGYRKYIYLAVNLLVIVLASSSALQVAVTFMWILLPYFCMRFLSKNERLKPLLIAAVVLSFVYLAKYGFVFSLLHLPDIFLFRILGLSYFLFRQIDYIMQYSFLKEEGYRLDITDYLNYLTGFYTLMAGPILRYRDFVDDFYKDDKQKGYIPLKKEEIMADINRIINGYIKIYLISAILDHYARSWFDGMSTHSDFLHTAGAFCIFAFLNCWFIYFNFSGYCDIVIAAADLSGLKVKENFNRPYLAANVIEFWNRHHITLSEWIRDYIFTPVYKWLLTVPLKRKTLAAQAVALFITFLVAGIWHGTTIDYVMYGLFQGLGVAVATLWRAKRRKLLGKERNKRYENNPIVITVSRIITWGYICLTFTFTGYPVMSLFG